MFRSIKFFFWNRQSPILYFVTKNFRQYCFWIFSVLKIYFSRTPSPAGHSLKSRPETRDLGPWDLGPWDPETRDPETQDFVTLRHGTLTPRTLELGPGDTGPWNWVPGTWDLRPWDPESWDKDPENWTCDTDS